MILLDKKVLFVHNMRTGGSTIENLFHNKQISTNSLFVKDHSDVSFWVDEHFPEMKEEILNDFFKFAFVRNTWERVASFYRLLKQWYVKDENYTWNIFINELVENNGFSPRFRHWKPQIEMMSYNNKIVMDYIGDFDNYEKDWYAICRKTKIKLIKPGVTNIGKKYPFKYNELQIEQINELYKDEIDMFNFKFRLDYD